MSKEIERTFLIPEIPEQLIPFEIKTVSQNYLSVKKDEEIRISLEDELGYKIYKMSYKNGEGLSRGGVKFEITEATYRELSDKILEKPIVKFRQFYFLGEKQIMIDTFEDSLFPLKMAEVEFDSEEEANSFTPPEWFGLEVTYDENYKNKNLWKKLNFSPTNK